MNDGHIQTQKSLMENVSFLKWYQVWKFPFFKIFLKPSLIHGNDQCFNVSIIFPALTEMREKGQI